MRRRAGVCTIPIANILSANQSYIRGPVLMHIVKRQIADRRQKTANGRQQKANGRQHKAD